MKTVSLDLFDKDINQIRNYLKFIELVNSITEIENISSNNFALELNTANLKDFTRGFNTEKRIFEYKAVIISLYGILEKYIELWIKDYLNELSLLFSKYTSINSRIRENHFNFSIRLIDLISSREYPKYQHITKEEVLDKLNTCIKNPEKYSFNSDAFTILSGNLKHKKIVELLSPLNIDLHKGLNSSEELLIEIGLTSAEAANREKDLLYSKINDLVDRRNIIAHGGKVDDLLDINSFNEYINFIEKYCHAVFNTFVEEIASQDCILNYKIIQKVFNVFNNKIIAFELSNNKIKIGDTIIFEKPDGSFCYNEILSIEIEKSKKEEVESKDSPINVGIEVKHRIKMNYKFYLKNRTSH